MTRIDPQVSSMSGDSGDVGGEPGLWIRLMIADVGPAAVGIPQGPDLGPGRDSPDRGDRSR